MDALQRGMQSYTAVSIVIALISVIWWSMIKFYVLTVLITSTATIVGLLAYLILSSIPRQRPGIKLHQRMKFLSQWDQQIADLSPQPHSLDNIAEESFLISETINDFIGLVLQEFVNGWFKSISPDRDLFQTAIRKELQSAVVKLKGRLLQLDLANLLVKEVVPIFTDHFNKFIMSEASVRKNHPDFDLIVANQFKKLHPGVLVGGSHIKSKIDKKSKDYLRQKVDSILPFLLSSSESESTLVRPLIREILACTILQNLLLMLSEGDFYNLLIVNLVGANLRHRTQVMKLREALAQHTNNSSGSSHTNGKPYYHFSEITKTEDFNLILRRISTLTSISELKKIQKYTDDAGVVPLRRLDMMKDICNKRLMQISQKFGQLTLEEILDDAKSRERFCDYLDKSSVLVSFWKDVENMKAPLEDTSLTEHDHDDDDEILSLGYSNSEDIRDIYKKYLYNHILGIQRALIEIVEEFVFSRNDDISRPKLYRGARRELFKLQCDVFQKLELEYPGFRRSNMFNTIVEDRSIKYTESQDNLGKYEKHGNRMFEELGETNENIVSPAVIKAVEDALTEIMRGGGEVPHEIQLTGLENPSNLQSLNNRLNPLTIVMKKNLFGDVNDSSTLFGDSKSLLSENRYSKLFDADENDKLHDEEDDGYLIDSEILEKKKKLDTIDDDSPFNSSSEALDRSDNIPETNELSDLIFLAGPGNLKLTEEIAKLNQEIEKLSEQHSILLPLLQKAEITNNLAELKILRKSRISLEREISSKELQKQQYIVQENDNSLYGKSKVSIQSYINGTDQGKEVILYIVEVQKFDKNNPDLISAGWIVARRFSQFYKLNEYLKGRYGSKLSSIKFPNRVVLVLKFQQEQIIELRKAALEEYLQKVIEIPDVCSDRVFRNFLSSENFNLGKNQLFDTTHQMGSGVQKSIFDNRISSIVQENLADMQQELKLYDSKNESFVKPICDLLISVFRLNTSKTWIRGRAIVVVLQQIFGTTIEQKMYELIDTFTRTEERVLDYLIKLRNIVFPNRKFKDPPVFRLKEERLQTKSEANVFLNIWIKDSCSRVFGGANSNWASTEIFNMLQNDFLNKHLVFCLLDCILDAMFPEISKFAPASKESATGTATATALPTGVLPSKSTLQQSPKLKSPLVSLKSSALLSTSIHIAPSHSDSTPQPP